MQEFCFLFDIVVCLNYLKEFSINPHHHFGVVLFFLFLFRNIVGNGPLESERTILAWMHLLLKIIYLIGLMQSTL